MPPGWHSYPGVGIVNVTNGELELVDAHDYATRTYTAGEVFLDPGGHPHKAHNACEYEPAEAYVTFLGVPEEKPRRSGLSRKTADGPQLGTLLSNPQSTPFSTEPDPGLMDTASVFSRRFLPFPG